MVLEPRSKSGIVSIKKLILMLACLALASSMVWGVTFESGTIIESEGLGLVFNVTSNLTVSSLVVDSDRITFNGLNQSYTGQASNNYTLSFNVTETSVTYETTSLPYISVDDYDQKSFVTGLTDDTFAYIALTMLDCARTQRIDYESHGDTFNKNYYQADFTCSGNVSSLNATFETGTNTFLIYTNTTQTFEFRDEDTNNSLAGTNVSLDILSDDYSINLSTDTGSINISLPSPDIYTLRYSASGYAQRFRFITTDDTAQTHVLYLGTNTSDVTVVIRNQIGDTVPEATVKAYKYDVATNSYLLVAEGETDFEGETRMPLELGSEFYKFLIYYEGVLKKETSPAYLYDTTITIYINTLAGVGEVFSTTKSISHNLIFQTANDRFKLTYDDSSDTITNMCLNVYRTDASTDTLYNSSCSTATSGMLYAGVLNVSSRTYTAKAYATIDGETIMITSLDYKYEDAGSEIFGKNGLVVALLLTLTAAGLGALFKPGFAIALAPLPLLVLSAVGVVSLSWGLMLGVEILALIIAGLVEAKNG